MSRLNALSVQDSTLTYSSEKWDMWVFVGWADGHTGTMGRTTDAA